MNAFADWAPAPIFPSLHGDEVHVWRATLGAERADEASVLSAEEWARSARFAFEPDRQQFIATRVILRRILARYVHFEPEDLRFENGPHGKPRLCWPTGGVHFNLSHSGDLLLLAVTRGREVGVDVEEMRANVPVETLADHYFEPEDAWGLRLLAAPEKLRRFYDLWTGTEARLKASGDGLRNGTTIVRPDRWSLRSLTPAEGYAAALAVEGELAAVACWSWPS